MKRRYMILVGVVVLAFGIPFFGMSVLAKEGKGEAANKKEDSEPAVAWDKLPSTVQQTIEAQLHTAKPEKITEEKEDGFTAYEAAQTVDGKLKEVKVAENGQLLEIEEAIPASELPAAVIEKAKKTAPKAEIKEARRVTWCLYEVDFGKENKPKEMLVFGNGQPVENDD